MTKTLYYIEVCLAGPHVEGVSENIEGVGKLEIIYIPCTQTNYGQEVSIVSQENKTAMVEQVIRLGILPIMGGKMYGHRNCMRNEVNAIVH